MVDERIALIFTDKGHLCKAIVLANKDVRETVNINNFVFLWLQVTRRGRSVSFCGRGV